MIVERVLAENPAAVLALPTGETPKPLYDRLVRFDLSRATTFNLDEYVGLAPDHPESFRRYMEERLFRRTRVGATHLPDGLARDLDRECASYEEAIAAAGGIDLCVLGLGKNGHIAFNEPGSAFTSRTRVVSLQDRPAPRAITMGIATILSARRCVLLATGAAKAAAVHAMIDEAPSERVPASALQRHAQTIILVDRAARPGEGKS